MGHARIDALLVLGGEDRDQWPRCRAALSQWRAYREDGLPPPRLIVSGGTRVRHQGRWTTEATLMVRFFRQHRIPVRDILVEPHATDTFGNIVWGGDLARQQGLHHLALVTDEFHHWRCRRIYEQVFGLTPAALMGTGYRAGWRAHLRERLAYGALRLALHRAGVPRGDFDAHRHFLEQRGGRPLNSDTPHGRVNPSPARSGAGGR